MIILRVLNRINRNCCFSSFTSFQIQLLSFMCLQYWYFCMALHHVITLMINRSRDDFLSRFLGEYNPSQNLVLVSKVIYHDFDLYQGGVVLRNVIDWFLIGYSLLDSDWLIPLSCLLQRSAPLDPQLEQVPSLFRK